MSVYQSFSSFHKKDKLRIITVSKQHYMESLKYTREEGKYVSCNIHSIIQSKFLSVISEFLS